MVELSPSILSADFANLERDIKNLEKENIKYLHVDVMDGHFVENITIGPVVVNSIRKKTDMILDVHLMIENPNRYIDAFCDAGADIITVHYEATNHIHGVVQSIKGKGVKAGVAINPGTPIDALKEILPDLDLVLIMSVNPGFGGQKFISSALKKIEYIKKVNEDLNLDIIIEVDGGIKAYNIKEVVDAGVNLVVAGSAIFNEESIKINVDNLKVALDEE
ncbi:MAG: ribulose-phosphate 3-epimerase [Bacillota bacterium]|nr:ribulose-phosphate 3-epimerase [Bacillota bacterium]